MTFLSIIIPFNSEKRFLKDCLDSLREEKLTDMETIIIINGISKDKEKSNNLDSINELINGYESDLNIITKIFDENIGVAKARNEGLELASGKYIYFIDSDDYIHEGCLNILVNIAKETDADLINGKRVRTYYIRERFEEELEKRDYDFLRDKKSILDKIKNMNKSKEMTDLESFIQDLVAKAIIEEEVLTALHCLMKKDLIDSKFNENKKYFSDYEFILNVFKNAKSYQTDKKSIYAKRLRDDRVNYPSLNQEADIDKFKIAYENYKEILGLVESIEDEEKKKLLKDEFDEKFIRYYFYRFSRQYRSNKNDVWRTEYFDMMSEIARTFDSYNIEKNKKEIKALQNHDRKTVEKLMNLRLAKRKASNIIFRNKNKKNAILKTIYLNKYNKEPIKQNSIVFESFRGDFYTDNPKYIYEYLLKNYGDNFEYVWVINDKRTKIPGNPKKVKRLTLEYYHTMATSKYWVLNGRQHSSLLKRDEQVLLETWHGTPLKKLGLDLENLYSGSPKYQKRVDKDSKNWDYLVSPNKYTTNILKRCFAYDGEMLETGYPRNDILSNADEKLADEIKAKLNLPKDKKIILYAPTWRDDEFFEAGQYKFTLKLDLKRMQEELSDEYIILTRLHYFIANNLDLSDYKGFAFDESKYDDIAELYLISDILITDYSSVFFDYANLKRPMLFYTYDLDSYGDVIRGFYFDMENNVPGPLLFTTEEVIDSIKNIEKINEQYREKYEEFYKTFCSLEKGDASRKIVERVWK